MLTKEKTSKLAVTSGTTGSPSMIPRVQSQEKPIRIAVAALSSAMYSSGRRKRFAVIGEKGPLLE